MYNFNSVNKMKLIRAVYLLTFSVFMLGFFIFPSDKVLHRVFIFLILLPFSLWVIQLGCHHKALFKHPLLYFMLVYLLYTALSGFWTVPQEVSMSWFRPFTRSVYIIVFCVMVAWVASSAPKFFQQLLTALVFSAAIVALLGIIYWWMSYGGDFSKRLFGITRAEHAIQGTASFAVIFILSLIRFSNAKTLLEKTAYVFAAGICFLFVILAQTRGVLIAMGAASLLFFIFKRDFKPLFIFGIIILLVLALSFYWVDWSTLGDRLTRSMPYRMEIWQTVLNEALMRPWFGHGFIHDSNVHIQGDTFHHAHNIYVSTFFFGGLVGVVLYGAMVLCALYYAYLNRFEEKYFFAGLVLIFASVAMLSDIGRVIDRPNDLWFYFWFPIGIILSTSRIAR